MTSRLMSRVERLEARAKAKAPSALCSGFLTPLPQDYTGERHVAEVKREPIRSLKPQPTGSPHFFWCQFEERPGLTRMTRSTLRSDGDAPARSNEKRVESMKPRFESRMFL
jgi:hypothetical protein